MIKYFKINKKSKKMNCPVCNDPCEKIFAVNECNRVKNMCQECLEYFKGKYCPCECGLKIQTWTWVNPRIKKFQDEEFFRIIERIREAKKFGQTNCRGGDIGENEKLLIQKGFTVKWDLENNEPFCISW